MELKCFIYYLLFIVYIHLEYGLEEAEVTESSGLIVELFPLGILSDRDEDVGGCLLEQLEEGEVPGLAPEILLDPVEGILAEAAEGDNHAIR